MVKDEESGKKYHSRDSDEPDEELPEEESVEEGSALEEELEDDSGADDITNPTLKKLGDAADASANEVVIAGKNIVFQIFKDGGRLIKTTVKNVGAFMDDPDHYVESRKQRLKDNLRKSGKRVKESVDGIADGAGKAAAGVKDSIAGTAGRIGDSAKDIGDTLKDKGVGGIAGDVVRRAGESLESSVSSVVEAQLASAKELYVPGFGVEIGLRLGEPVYREQAREVKYFVSGLKDDYATLPLNLGFGDDASPKNTKARQRLLEDFIGYGTTDVDYLLMHLKLRRGDIATDADPTATKNEVAVLEGAVGAAIREMRGTYIAKESQEEVAEE